MNHDAIVKVLQGMNTPAGFRAFLSLLGFREPHIRAPRPSSLPRTMRSLRVSWRTTLCACVLRAGRACGRATVHAAARSLREADPAAHQFLIIVEPHCARVTFACDALHDGLRHLTIDRDDLRSSDIEAIQELIPDVVEDDTAAALRITRALDRSRVGRRFFRDVTACRDTIARSWTGLPEEAQGERDALALLLISRLMFLYFLQRRGLLDGDPHFLTRQFSEWQRLERRPTFYATSLRTLFFHALNRRPGDRGRAAFDLGELPYLNGGLFERHRLERRRPRLDLPDAVFGHVLFGLLEKYRFTAGESPDHVHADGVDPEMLGRIYEGLMPGPTRSRTGTFYTPAPLVAHVAALALSEHLGAHTDVAQADVAALLAGETSVDSRAHYRIADTASRLRVLDPACGSGAFLLGALDALERLALRDFGHGCAAVDMRRRIVAKSLYGVDLLADAALICSLRLWLALVPDCERAADVPPLPNLDRRIRQGDALVDPLYITSIDLPSSCRPALREIGPAAREYLVAGPPERAPLRRRLNALERTLAKSWLDTIERRLHRQINESVARAADVDLFGESPTAALSAKRALPALRKRLAELTQFRSDVAVSRGLPFFSFRVHFAEADSGFDLVLSNPPWIRSHHWPVTVRAMLRERYAVCANAGWPYAASLSGHGRAAGAQVDLSLLFLELAVRVLSPAGTIGMLLPAKLIRSLYPGGARALIADHMKLIVIEDHSLDHRAAFEADAFTCVLVARREDDATLRNDGSVRVRMTRSGVEPLCFEVAAADLPLRRGDDQSPWLLAPTGCAAALRSMQRHPSIGEQGMVVRRGAMTGANDLMLIRDLEPGLGDVVRIRSEGYERAGSRTERRRFTGLVEASAVRPALRGTDIASWSARVERHVIWSTRNDDVRAAEPRLLAAFLRRAARSNDRASDDRFGMLHRLSEHTFGNKVVWSDLASDLRAAAVRPAYHIPGVGDSPIVPLNSVYFMPTASMRESLILAAYLNSLPVRTFARTVAERAKDAHFRFFAWVIAILPLPVDWRNGCAADELLELSTSAHARGCITASERDRLETIVAAQYGLDDCAILQLAALDAWLTGRTA